MKKRSAKGFAGVAIKFTGTVFFLWWAFSQIKDKQPLGENLSRALQSPFWVAAGLGLAFLTLLANALRWFFLLRAQFISLPFWYIFRLTLVGAFFNIASVGAAAGDAAKVVLLMRRVPGNKAGVTMSVMVDHVIGLVASISIFLVFTWGFGTIGHVKDMVGRGIFVAATWFQMGGLAIVILGVVSCTPVALAFGGHYLPRLTDNKWVRTITSAIDLFRTRWHYALYSLLVSFVLSASFYLTFYAGLRALDQQIKTATIMAVMPIVDVVSSLPISISGLGVRERTFDFLLSQLTGISTAVAVTASLIGFLFNLFWGLVGGVTFVVVRNSKKSAENSTTFSDES